jgi:hypothetical protein
MNRLLEHLRKRGKAMEFLIPLGVVVAWIILMGWVLPHLGVKT